MFLSTSVLVLAFSRASLWNSIVDNVPSICASCFSYLFLRFRACRAAAQQRTGGLMRSVPKTATHTRHHGPLSTEEYLASSSVCCLIFPDKLCCPTFDLSPSIKLFRGVCCLMAITCPSRMPAQTLLTHHTETSLQQTEGSNIQAHPPKTPLFTLTPSQEGSTAGAAPAR